MSRMTAGPRRNPRGRWEFASLYQAITVARWVVRHWVGAENTQGGAGFAELRARPGLVRGVWALRAAG